MAFRQGDLLRAFLSENNSDREVAPDVLARALAKAEDAPVNPFLLKPTGSQKEQRERMYAQENGVLAGMRGAEEKKKREDSLANEWFTRVVLGRMTPAQWDGQMTSFGGRQMSNAEAQKIRKWALSNFDDVFKAGVAKGKFKEEDGSKLKASFERYVELNDKEKFNTQTEEEKEELKKLREDKDIQTLETAIVEMRLQVEQNKGLKKSDRADNDVQPRSNLDEKHQATAGKGNVSLASEFADVAGDFTDDPTHATPDVPDKKSPTPAILSGPV